MNDIMTEIRKLKDAIAREEDEKKTFDEILRRCDEDKKFRIYLEVIGSLEGIRMNRALHSLRIDCMKARLKELRRKAYHTEGECRYIMLDLNDIAGVIDKDGFIRGIKF